MIATIELMKEWFPKFNKEYFDNELPEPKFELMQEKTVLGNFQTCKRLDMMANPYRIFIVRLSTYFDTELRDLQETFIHELIHYFVSYKEIEDTSSHGEQWKKNCCCYQ